MTLMELLGQADQGEEAVADESFRELQEAVSFLLPAVRTAALLEVNPIQAKNEMRAACHHVLDERPWLAPDAALRERLVLRYLDSVFGFGPLEGLLDDDAVTEIMVNGPASVFYERDGKMHPLDLGFNDDEEVMTLIDRMIAPLGRRVDESSPMVNARLPEGHRVNAVIPPLALDGPVLTIRKFKADGFTLADLRARESIDDDVRRVLEALVRARANIAVSGGTGSGKTTLLNALSGCIPVFERIITIEDSAELRFTHPHVVRLEARPRNAEGFGEVTIRDLVANALRMRPDRIVVGECRGAEALDMLQAMNTGHDGSLTTLHANSPHDAVSRLTTMVRYAAELPVEVIESQIASAIDVVVQTVRGAGGERFVSSLVASRFDQDRRRCLMDEIYSRRSFSQQGRWLQAPDEVLERVFGTGEDVDAVHGGMRSAS